MIASLSALKLDIEPKKLLFTSEPYVIFTSRGYQAVADVLERKSKREYFLYLSAQSLAKALEQLKQENGDRMTGIECWIRKSNTSKLSKYVVEE